MNYATWKLNFTDPNYGTGPEDTIADLGFGAEGAWVSGDVENDGLILGYVTEAQDESALTPWDFTNISQLDALELALSIDPQAFLTDDGKITRPIEDLGF
jgi:hypothetical protein